MVEGTLQSFPSMSSSGVHVGGKWDLLSFSPASLQGFSI